MKFLAAIGILAILIAIVAVIHYFLTLSPKSKGEEAQDCCGDNPTVANTNDNDCDAMESIKSNDDLETTNSKDEPLAPSKFPIIAALFYLPILNIIWLVVIHNLAALTIGSRLSTSIFWGYEIWRILKYLIFIITFMTPAIIFRFIIYRKPIQRKWLAFVIIVPLLFAGLFFGSGVYVILNLDALRTGLNVLIEIMILYYILRYGIILTNPDGTPCKYQGPWWKF